MKISLDSKCILNVKRLNNINDDQFTVKINNDDISVPIHAAASFSSKITRLLMNDNTIREITTAHDFRNPQNKSKIIQFLNFFRSYKPEINDEDDIFDFAEFGYQIGNREFIAPIKDMFAKQKYSEITIDNALNLVEMKNIINKRIDSQVKIDKELSFISRNFSCFSDNERFVELCTRTDNLELAELIIGNDNLHLKNEDDLLNFIMKIGKVYKPFMNLLGYVHLEFCSIKCCEKLLNYITAEDLLQERLYRENILMCLSKKLLYDSTENLNEAFIEQRLDKSAVDVQNNSNTAFWKNKFEEQMNLCRFEPSVKTSVVNGNLASVKYFINKKHENVEETNSNGLSLLSMAAFHGYFNIVQFLYESCHADVESKSKKGCTPLHYAVQEGNKKIVKYLIGNCKANVEAKENFGYTPLHIAVMNDNLEIVKYLVEKCHANVEARTNKGHTPLFIASKNGYISIVKYLVEECNAEITQDSINSAINVKSYLDEYSKR